MGLDRSLGVAVGAPDEPLNYLRLAHGPAQLAQHPHVHLDGQTLAVDQHAVAIEDHQLDRPRHGVDEVALGARIVNAGCAISSY